MTLLPHHEHTARLSYCCTENSYQSTQTFQDHNTALNKMEPRKEGVAGSNAGAAGSGGVSANGQLATPLPAAAPALAMATHPVSDAAFSSGPPHKAPTPHSAIAPQQLNYGDVRPTPALALALAPAPAPDPDPDPAPALALATHPRLPLGGGAFSSEPHPQAPTPHPALPPTTVALIKAHCQALKDANARLRVPLPERSLIKFLVIAAGKQLEKQLPRQ